MPKIILNIRDSILVSAHRQLHETGYRGLSLRQISQDCNIAIGTTYNYFPSKSKLAFEIMRLDWDECMKNTETIDTNKFEFEDCIRNLFNVLSTFRTMYDNIRDLDQGDSELEHITLDYHESFVTDIASRISDLLDRYNQKESDSFIRLCAECLYSASVRHADEETYMEFVRRIIRGSLSAE